MAALSLRPSAALAPRAVATAADAAAARHVFAAYRERCASNTRLRQDGDLALLARFLGEVGFEADAGDLASLPSSWSAISWGLVAAFVAWQLQQGYAIGSINVRLATVKRYAQLAMQAGAISAESYAQIKAVGGYRGREGRNVDQTRETTRTGTKKAQPVRISQAQAALLKAQPAPLDALLMCLLLDHGLRVGEVVQLRVEHVDRTEGSLIFYREKVDKTQTHELSVDTLRAALAALAGRTEGLIFGCSTRTLQNRVRGFGEAIGLAGLSPHDCRHAWATFATRAGTAVRDLQEAGGWASPAMPLCYAEAQAVANQGVKLR